MVDVIDKMVLSEILMGLNVLIALGTVVSGVVSWVKGGFIRRLFDSVQKIEEIERDVQEINGWKNDIEVLMVALSKTDDGVDEEAVMDELDLGIGYKEYMVGERLVKEDKASRSD